MSHVKNKVEWCLRKAEKELHEGKKHRGLRKVNPDLQKAREHIVKAERNLKATLYLREGGYTDWCSSTLFYVIYHCFRALLVKHGYESRNQECTFALLQSLIEERLVTITLPELEKVFDMNIKEGQESPDVVSIREESQYSTTLTLKDESYTGLLQFAKEILHKTKLMLEE